MTRLDAFKERLVHYMLCLLNGAPSVMSPNGTSTPAYFPFRRLSTILPPELGAPITHWGELEWSGIGPG
jgi:hypothetical protein